MNYLYRHIRPDTNEVFYIGIGKQNSKRAWSSRYRTQLWNRVVEKNDGKYEVEIILEDLTNDQVNAKEKEFILLYGRKADNSGTLVNFQLGGRDHRGQVMSSIRREELRLRMLGNTFNVGKSASEATKSKMSASHKGIRPNVGRIWPQEVKDRMSESHKGNTATKGRIWIHRGQERTLINPTAEIPYGWTLGKGMTKIY